MKGNPSNSIRYIPGIFSLIIIPFLFIGFTKSYLKKQNTFAIPVVWADLSLVDKYKEMFAAYRNHFPPLRNYTKIRLDDNKRSNKTKLDFSVIEAIELVKSNDTLNGIHLVFDKESSYEDFIKAIDICRISGAKTYMPYKNNLWVYNLPVIPKNIIDSVKEVYCGTTSMMVKHKNIDNISIARTIPIIWQASWSIIVGFVVLITFSIKSIVLSNRIDR